CVSHANDFAPADAFVSTASGLLLVYGVGATLGPLAAGAAMQWLGPAAFLSFLIATHLLLALFILVRMRVRSAPPPEPQAPFVVLVRTSPSALEMLAPEGEAEKTDPS